MKDCANNNQRNKNIFYLGRVCNLCASIKNNLASREPGSVGESGW